MKIGSSEVTGWYWAIHGMRKSFGSEEHSDSEYDHYGDLTRIGEKDLRLMKTLTSKGSSHRKFLRAIDVKVAVSAPLSWWAEFDTYKVGTVRLSGSTMHTLKKSFDPDNFEPIVYQKCPQIIDTIEEMIEDGADITDIKDLLPSGYNLDSVICMNYEHLCAIWKDRKKHKMRHWKTFLNWMEGLFYFKELIGEN